MRIVLLAAVLAVLIIVVSCGVKGEAHTKISADVDAAAVAIRRGDEATDGGSIDKSAAAESSTSGDGAKSVTVAGGGSDSVTSMILAGAALMAALGDGPLRRMWRDRRGGLQAEVDELRRRLDSMERRIAPSGENTPGGAAALM